METQVQTISDETLAAAAAWWAKAIQRPKFDNGGTDDANMMARMLMTVQAKHIPEHQVEAFEKKLAELMRERTPAGSPYLGLTIAVDYHPDQILCKAADPTGIPHGNFPWKTVMWIEPDGGGLVTVRHGYGADAQLIFGDPIWTVHCVSNYLMGWAAGRKGNDRPGVRDFFQQGNECEQAIGTLHEAFKFKGWPAPVFSDSERVRTADATREHRDLELLGSIVNSQVKLAQEQPSPETYLAAILAHQRLSDQLAAWVAALTASE